MKKTDKKTDMIDSKIADGDLNKDSQSRRKLLTALGGGGVLAAGNALPQNWAKPVVDAVVLPAHAATTSEGGGTDIIATTTPDPCAPENYSITECFSADTQGTATLSANCSGINVDLQLYTMMGAMTKGDLMSENTDGTGVASFTYASAMGMDAAMSGDLARFTAANGTMCEAVVVEL